MMSWQIGMGGRIAIGLLVLPPKFLSWVYRRDVTQKKYAALRNHPIIGHFRHFFVRVAHCAKGMNKEIEMIAYRCGASTCAWRKLRGKAWRSIYPARTLP